MRRRFRAGAAADVTVWLLMLRDQYARQLATLAPPIDTVMAASYAGTRRYLEAQVATCGALAGRAADAWRLIEWDRAAETFAHIIDPTTGAMDGDAAAAAQTIDTRDTQES